MAFEWAIWLTQGHNWQWGVVLLAILPPIAAFAHLIYYVYIVPDEDEEDQDLGGAAARDLAVERKMAVAAQPARGKKKQKRKQT